MQKEVIERTSVTIPSYQKRDTNGVEDEAESQEHKGESVTTQSERGAAVRPFLKRRPLREAS